MKKSIVAASAICLALGMVMASAPDAEARRRGPGVSTRGPAIVYRPSRSYRVYRKPRPYRYIAPLVGGIIIGEAVRRSYYSSPGLSW